MVFVLDAGRSEQKANDLGAPSHGEIRQLVVRHYFCEVNLLKPANIHTEKNSATESTSKRDSSAVQLQALTRWSALYAVNHMGVDHGGDRGTSPPPIIWSGGR